MFDHRALREWGFEKGWDVMIKTPNQPTPPQLSSFLRFLNEQNLTKEQFQNYLENGDLVKLMLNCSGLSKVDRAAFTALLAPKLTIPWTPVSEYPDRILKRSKLRGWGFTQADADKLTATLHDHAGDLQPTGISMWLGKDLKFNWAETLLWLKDEVESLKYSFLNEYFSPDKLSSLSGSEKSGKQVLDVVDLDLETFWDKSNGIVPGDVRPNRKKWPGLEAAILLALNPQVFILMDGETVPYMFASGLVIDGSGLPGFSRYNHKVYVPYRWGDSRWYGTTMVAFREC